MSEARAQYLIDAGHVIAPAKGYQLLTPSIDPRKTPYTAQEAARGDINLYLGWQPRRCAFLYLDDLDSHNPGQDAQKARAAFEAARPELAAKLDWHPSQNGGWHAFFESKVKLATGKLYDSNGNHIGERLGKDSDRTLDPGTLNVQILHKGEVERLQDVWCVASGSTGEDWKERAKQGARWTRGYPNIKRTQLRTFLVALNTKTSLRLAEKLDTAVKGERSDLAGNLAQCLMFNAHKLPCGWGADFFEKCRTVKGYWMAADSFGKALDKDYSQEKDGDSLIAQIVHEDPLQNGGKWTCPFWAKGNQVGNISYLKTTDNNVNNCLPRPAHRPVGDKAKHLATFRRVLEAIEPDDFGRRVYTLEYLAEKMKMAKLSISPRTIQSYLWQLRKDKEIVTAQIGGNGRPYAVLTSCFGGAIKSEIPAETTPEPLPIGGANEIAIDRIETPQTAELSPVCIVDHQNPFAPAEATFDPRAAWYGPNDPRARAWRNPTEMRVPDEPIDRRAPAKHKQPHIKGQRTIEAELQEPMAERQARERAARIDRLAANVAQAEARGARPVKRAQRLKSLQAAREYPSGPITPTPYKKRVRLPEASLPDLGAPVGAQSAGAPLPAPAGAAYDAVGMIERLQARL